MSVVKLFSTIVDSFYLGEIMPIKDPEKRAERNRSYQKKWYEANKETQYARLRKVKSDKKQWFLDIKKELKCCQCAENHIATLDFHHIDPMTKEESVSTMLRQGRGRQRILDEIAKCIVLCSNCHRKLHYVEA